MDMMNIDSFHHELKKYKILSCIIKKDNDILLSYFSNQKMKKQVQTINSVTKTVVGVLIGIAMQKGLIKDLKDPIFLYFPTYEPLFDELKKRITIEHLLTMTDGLDWPEFGEWNCFAPMVYQSDIISFILSRPMLHTPGKVMNYNSGASHLLGAILQRVTNESLHQFAKKVLFHPLEIYETIWHEKQGVCLAADGLKIKTEDLIKIGSLFNEDSTNLIDRKWLEAMMQPVNLTYSNLGFYGYHIWIDKYNAITFCYALGFGGQFLVIVPEFKLVIALTSRIYNNTTLPMNLIKKHILSSLCKN